jgi:RNA polymerase sigma factor (sigma-70 family)
MDVSEFTARTERLKNRLYRTALLYVGSESIALDAVDEAIYRGFKSLKKLRQPEYFETWMTRILINECKKELRRRKHEQPIDTIPETAEERFDTLPLKDAILRLPGELKEVIILRYFSGFTLAETAESLEIPQGTVVTRQRRALRLLKLELSEEE